MLLQLRGERSAAAGRKVRKFHKSAPGKLALQPPALDVDRSARPEREGEHDPAARGDDTAQFVEEGDRVREHDEVERAVLEREARGVRLLEAQARMLALRGLDHRGGEVDADDVGL